MTNKHLNQCLLNEEFLKALFDKFPTQFFDWKTTVVFYAATHLIRGYALTKGTTIGGSHTEVFDFIKKETGDKSELYQSFRILYRNSRDTRYSGFAERVNFEFFCKFKFDESKVHYGKIKTYTEAEGILLEV